MGIFIELLGARETGVNKMKISALMELTVCWGKRGKGGVYKAS